LTHGGIYPRFVEFDPFCSIFPRIGRLPAQMQSSK
jgi:hypothetical protein